MEVHLRWDIPAIDHLNRWLRRQGITPDDCRLYGRFYMDAIEQLLEENKGIPADAQLQSEGEEATYSLEFVQGELWMLYTRKVIGGWWQKLRGKQIVEIVIRNLYARKFD